MVCACRLRMGDFVPADAQVTRGSCGVDQSALTGESVILDRGEGALLFGASLMRRGEVTAVVTATGASTFFGEHLKAFWRLRSSGAIRSLVHALFALLCAGKTAKLVDDSKPRTHIDTVVASVTKGLMSVVVVACLIAVIVVAATDVSKSSISSLHQPLYPCAVSHLLVVRGVAGMLLDTVSLLLVVLVASIPVALVPMYTTRYVIERCSFGFWWCWW
jgi:magnesium-transporting ATPase (P-type)